MASISFIELLWANLDAPCSKEELAKIVANSAIEVLQRAALGDTITDDFTKEQTGFLIALLMWNFDPKVRGVVRPQEKSIL